MPKCLFKIHLSVVGQQRGQSVRRNDGGRGVSVCCVCALTEGTAAGEEIDTETNLTISQADSDTAVKPMATMTRLAADGATVPEFDGQATDRCRRQTADTRRRVSSDRNGLTDVQRSLATDGAQESRL